MEDTGQRSKKETDSCSKKKKKKKVKIEMSNGWIGRKGIV